MDTRRLVYPSVILLLVLSCNFFQSLNPTGENSAAVSRALLNEVLFLPAQGGHAFVELKTSGGRVPLDGLYLTNEAGDIYTLPADLDALPPDRFLLVVFDGIHGVEGDTVHADRIDYLNPETGFIELHASDGTLLDRVAWGMDQPASVKLSRGGIISELEPGTTIGRFPLSVQPDPLEWTVFSPIQATPGTVNPQPGVEVMIPLNGAVMTQTGFDLSWYPVPGAMQYLVQVSGDETFGALTMDETVSAGSLTVELQPGKYFWRVQAISEGGETAAFSPAQTITVNPGFSGSGHVAALRAQITLAVPFIGQHKDTQMLLLESKNETGLHAWDVDHGELGRSDPADNGNCALASVAMINAFYGGDLSQDRIGFEIFHDSFPGPEYDLMYGQGLYFEQTTKALAFALEGESVFLQQPDTFDVDLFWADIQLGIDAGGPILAAKLPGHAMVITGYYEDNTTRYVMINDPWWGAYAVDMDAVTWKYYWMTSPDSIPTLNDPEIGMDSDGDGIVDFDEINRFGTDPNDEDTDKDDLKDKDDLRASIYDEQWGYALASLSFLGRDYDNDGVKMELDEDSDGGGCFDGMEDFDLDGKYKEPETWNFDEKDDACFWGTDELVMDVTTVYDDGGSNHQYQRHFAKFSLRAVGDGKLEGVAQVSYTHTGEDMEVDSTCGGTYTLVGGETHVWQVDLSGDFQKLPDGSVLVSAEATPDHGPAYTLQWIGGPCASYGESWQDEGWAWPGLGGTLKDGVYDYYYDMTPMLIDQTGEWWQKIYMKQGEGN